jgi:hypothetical protein
LPRCTAGDKVANAIQIIGHALVSVNARVKVFVAKRISDH